MTMTYFTNGKFGTGPEPGGLDGTVTRRPPGYTQLDSLGAAHALTVTLHVQDDRSETGPDYVVAICDGGSSQHIGVTGLRDAMDLLARWAPVTTASVLSYLCGIAAGDDSDGALAWLIARTRADEQDGSIDRAEDEILAARKAQRQAWMAAQDETPEETVTESAEPAVTG